MKKNIKIEDDIKMKMTKFLPPPWNKLYPPKKSTSALKYYLKNVVITYKGTKKQI